MKKRNKKRVILIVTVVILVGLCCWTIWGNTVLEINEYAIMSDKIPEAFTGFRIAQVSDLHNAEFGDGNEKLIELLSQTDPDIIVITGDLIDSRHTDIEIALEFARQAINIAPIYYVSGNHEARVREYEDLKMGLAEAGVNVLEDQISHRPELFDLYVETEMDLVFSGHAHGGQFRLPFIGGLVAPNQGFFPKYDAGLFSVDSTNMIVSRGVGNSIIPIRFNNRPEIVVAVLNPVT